MYQQFENIFLVFKIPDGKHGITENHKIKPNNIQIASK
jgi:hypothetical protein